jgi:uncharacterized protein (DUF849 family)
MATPLIIEAALNGVTPKDRNPHAPHAIEEIAAAARACLDAGASIIHHHNAEGLLHGRHASAPYREVWRSVRATHPQGIFYPTMGGGGPHTSIDERYAHIEELAESGDLELAIIDPGSVNLAPVGGDGLPLPIDLVYQNTFADVSYMVEVCRRRRLAVHISIFEPGFLRVALAYHRAGRLPPAKIQLYFGGEALPFGLPPTAASLEAYIAMLEGSGLPWMVGVIGGDVSIALAEIAIRCGGHVRVGLEDYDGPRQPRNQELVAEIVALGRRHGREPASATEAREIIGLKR